MPTLTVKNYKGGYSTNDSFTLEDNQFVEAQNVTYNTQSLLETAAGYQEFGAAVGAGDKAVTSIFFHKLDDGTRLLLATAGTSLYKYDDSAGTWSSIYTNFKPAAVAMLIDSGPIPVPTTIFGKAASINPTSGPAKTPNSAAFFQAMAKLE